MSTFKINFDVHIVNGKDYVPFDQVMGILKELDKHTPNINLQEAIQSLRNSRDQARSQLS